MFVSVIRAGANPRAIGRRRSTDIPDGNGAEQPRVAPGDLREQIYNLLEDPSSSGEAKLMSMFILGTIAVSIINFMIASYPYDLCGYVNDGDGTGFDAGTRLCAQPGSHPAGDRVSEQSWSGQIETVCIIIFTAEYVARLTVCYPKMSRLRFLIDPLNLLDVLAIFPYYIDLIIGLISDNSGSGSIFSVLRILRLTRVLRVFKVSRSMQSMIVLVRTLKRSFSAFMILITSIMVCMLFFGSFLAFLERGTYNVPLKQYLRDDGSPSPFLSIPHCMYWCMTTMTTVGYGDLYPVTGLGQVIAMFAMVSGIVVLSVPITVIGANFDEETREQHRVNQLKKRVVENQRTAESANAEGQQRGSVAESANAEVLTPGQQEVNCLLDDHMQNVLGDLSMLVSKSETTFTQLVRKVVIQSRVLTAETKGVKQSSVA